MKRAYTTAYSALTATALVAVALCLNIMGCREATSEVDPAALYSPESLAQEFAFRYRSLNSESRTPNRALSPRAKPDDNASKSANSRPHVAKTGVEPKAETKKKGAGFTIDDLLADIDSKIDKINRLSRIEICNKMKVTISSDPSLSPADKTTITDLIAQLATRH